LKSVQEERADSDTVCVEASMQNECPAPLDASLRHNNKFKRQKTHMPR